MITDGWSQIDGDHYHADYMEIICNKYIENIASFIFICIP